MTTSASPRPRRMRAAARREQLLDVTTSLVSDEGFHAASVEAVAQRCGITRAVVYQHFDDLQALLQAVIAREMAKALDQVAQTALEDLSTGDPTELMLESLGRYLRAVCEHPTTWRLVLMPPEGAPEKLRLEITKGRSTVLERLTRAVRPALVGDGHGDPDSDGGADLTARILSAIADEYARLVLTDADRFPPERLLRHARWWLGQASFGLSASL